MNKLLLNEFPEKVYWLHVRDGREVRYSTKPYEGHVRTLRVEVRDDGFEYTTTVDVEGPRVWQMCAVKPPGEGWTIWDMSRDKKTVWRRLAVRP